VALLAATGRASGSEASVIFFGAGLLFMIALLCFAQLAAHRWARTGGGRLALTPVRAGVLTWRDIAAAAFWSWSCWQPAAS